jgi:hypothetical protein
MPPEAPRKATEPPSSNEATAGLLRQLAAMRSAKAMEAAPALPRAESETPTQGAPQGHGGLLPHEASWLASHPVARHHAPVLDRAFNEALALGLARGSAGYFQHLENALQNAVKPPPMQQQHAEPEPDEVDRVVYAAPVTRGVMSAGTGAEVGPDTKITLTAEQRQVAAASGVSDLEYAKQLLRMNHLKARGLLQDGGG